MSDQLALEGVALDKKDKSELQSIVAALGGKPSARARKADLIQQILELSGVTAASQPASEPAADADSGGQQLSLGGDAGEAPAGAGAAAGDPAPAEEVTPPADTVEPSREAGQPVRGDQGRGEREDRGQTRSEPVRDREPRRPAADRNGAARDQGGRRDERGGGGRPDGGRPRNAGGDEEQGDGGRGGSRPGRNERDGRPGRDGNQGDERPRGQQGQQGQQGQSRPQTPADERGGDDDGPSGDGDDRDQGQNRGDDGDSSSRRRRRRGRDRDRDRDREESQAEPVPVEGLLDLRDEGYGFLRVNGYLPTRDDVYVPVKYVRQFGLRRGDFVTGLSRPAARNEKNPALHQVDTVNGRPADELPERPRFEDLTPLFPDERIRLEHRDEPHNMTARIIDLVAPIGKGQRGLIVSPPKAGKTTIMKQIARAIETNHPEVELIVLLVDERPEEVTDMRRWLQRGSVVSSTFDRPSEEHCAVAELTIERAKRMVEEGRDVCIMLDGITRLARAYNLAAPGTGRIMSGGVDSGALYPPKKFFGAARNIEEGGSLTILATALVETGSKMDEVIFEEFKGTGNMELRLDRRMAERRTFPAVDVTASSTRHEELLFERRQVSLVYKLRRVLAGVAGGDEGHGAAATELLLDRLASFRTNDEFLAEIAKAPTT